MMNDGGWDDDLDFGDDESTSEQEESGNIQLGQGLLFGGLSRLIEAVTQPEESNSSLELDANEEEEGWDDDGLDELVDENEQNNNGGGWQEDDNVLENVMVDNEPPAAQPSPAPLLLPVNVPPTPQESTGWDDDDLDGLQDESLHEESQIQEEPQQNSGWDDTLEGLDDSFQAEVNATKVPAETSGGGGGWDHDSLQGLDHDHDAPVAAVQAQQNTEDEDAGGWGNDVDLSGLDDDHDNFEAAQPVVVDHVPKPRAPVRTESMLTNADSSTVLRENALDDQEFEPSDDYGPVVDHFPSEHGTDHVARTVSTLVPESCADTLEEENGAKVKLAVEGTTPNAVIDHVPDDVSNVPTSNNDDSTASVDGDEPSEMPRQDSGEEGDTIQGDFGPMVDRLPSEQYLPLSGRAESMITNISSSVNESLSEARGGEKAKSSLVAQPKEVDHVPDSITDVSTKNNGSTASVDGDEPFDMPEQERAEQDESVEADFDFGPVVDHMPSQHLTGPPDRTVSTIAPSSLNEELDEEAVENGAKENLSERAVYADQLPPGVVDHVPEDESKSTNRNSTLAAATEMSVASELSNTLGDEALESDVDAQEENYGPVVDHTPLQQSVHSRRNPSVKVQAPIEEIDEETDDEEQYFGPVVDHTPAVQASAVSSVTGSMAVAAPPSEVDDDSDDRSDTVDEQGGEVSDFCDDDTLDAPTASLVSVSRYGPALVDHVPNRPGVRPTDASTLVVVDPSEVSTVGDMTYEEQQYGPVVDHLPSTHPVAQASATGSTVVAATASVGPDDTLVDDDDVADGEGPRDENESERDDDETLPTLDNQPPMETNVVDHVPEEGPPVFRIDSVLTTAPTQSVLSPDETRDSEFGLVVDHLPSNLLPSPPSRGSMAVLAPESVLDTDAESGTVEEEVSAPAGEQPASERTTEEAKVVVDHLPPARESISMHPTDSTVTVRSHVSDDDTLEGVARPDRFGPVVDHLPASGVSVQRSLGGSTTGALATLSEVNDDTIVDEDAPGWEYDEQELDSLHGAETSRQSRARPASRGLSVTFSQETVKTVQVLDEAEGNRDLFTSIADETQYFDAELGDTPAKVNDTQETQYFDSESGEMVNDESGDSARDQAALLHINGDVKQPATQCTACDEAKGVECPCIQRILRSSADDDAMVMSLTTPEGVPVEIDFKKLLQDETTKRLLLEKELEALKSTVTSLETAVSQSEAESTEDKMTAKKLRESTDIATRELDSVRGERDAFASEAEELTAQLAASRDEIAKQARVVEERVERESQLQAEMEKLRRMREESRSESQQLAAMGDELATEVDQMRNANEDLLIELDRRKGACDALEAQNKGLVDDCASKEKLLTDMAHERADLSSRNSALEDETIQLRRALEESSSAATSEADLRNQLSSLQIEAATKSGECEELKAQIVEVQKRLQESEGRCFSQMKESTRVKRLHDAEIQSLQEQIQSFETSKQAVVREHQATADQLNDKISRMDSELQSLKSEKESLERTVKETKSAHDVQMRQERSSFQAQVSQLRALETKVRALETEKAKTSEDLSSTRLQLQDSAEQVAAAAALKDDYESLQETLVVNKDTIQSLQEQVEVLSQANKTGTDQMETLVESISSERDSLRDTLLSNEKEMQALQSELQVRASEKASLEDRLETLAAKCGELEASVEDLQSNVIKQELELAEKDRVCESIRESQLDTTATSQVREEYEREVSNLNQLVSEREENLRLVQSQLEEQVNAIRERDVTISELEQQRSESQERVEAITRDRDNTLSRFKELDAELARTKEQQNSFKESASHQSAKEHELQQTIESLVSDRDAALKERDLLEEDSEELLVQLGLMKEQLDAHESEVVGLQQIIAEKEVAVKHAEDRLREAEGYIGELSRTDDDVQLEENGTHEQDKLAELQQTVDELTLAKEDLQQQSDDLSSTNAYIDAQITSLRDEKMELLGRLREAEQLAQATGADATAREQQYQSRIRELEEQCRHLDEVSRLKEEELGQARSKLQEAQASSTSSQADINSLQQQIAQLENACAEQGQVLHDRDRALEDMMLEIEGLQSHGAATSAPTQPNVDVDLDTLWNRLHHAERSAQHYQERLRELEAVLEQARRELKSKTEKLSETESALFDKELELDLQQQEKVTQGELQKQLHEMEKLLKQRNQEIQDAFERERSMEKTLGELQADSTGTTQNTSSTSENGPSHSNAVEETRQLRAQLSALQQQLQSSSAEHSEREERARQEVVAMNESISTKKEQIESLEKQLQSLSVEFSSSQDQLVSKEADYRRLSLELEESRGDQLQSTRTVTSQVLESCSKEQAESVDNMRSHIVSLAQALERSETQRADAIERLLRERKASADSLRRLGESVKRFYSSLSYRDA